MSEFELVVNNKKQPTDERVDPLDVIEQLIQDFETTEHEDCDAALLKLVNNLASVILTDFTLTQMFLERGTQKLAQSLQN